jgi:hypothetical protein
VLFESLATAARPPLVGALERPATRYWRCQLLEESRYEQDEDKALKTDSWGYRLDYRFKGPQSITAGSLQGVCQRMIGDMPSFPGFNAPLLTVVVHLPLSHCVCTGFLQVPAAAKGPDLHSFKGKQIPI